VLKLGVSGRRAVVLLAAVLTMLATARLGLWQLDRARQKLDLQARILARAQLPTLPQAELPREAGAAEAQYYRPVLLRGRWLADRTVYLDNRQMNARQGFYVVTPLLLAPGDAVLVQRGWMPRDFNDRTRLAPLPAQAGEVLVTGRVAPPPGRLLALAGADTGAIRQNLDPASFANEIGVALRPLSVQQTAATQPAPAADEATAPRSPLADDGLLRQWPEVAVDVGMHQGYAFQWFAMCALVAGLTVWFQFLRPRWRPQPPTPPVA
jgi:surfeit locus 1 family protein